MKTLIVQGESKSENVVMDKRYDCYECNDSGEVNDVQYDHDSHNYYNDGSTKPCICQL